ncbi:MAG: hypothetical protein LBU36_06935 [Clostridiales bacterium]|jgi:hypothetical protein|nr:hypothetical protein [Clostridiales bacterium]
MGKAKRGHSVKKTAGWRGVCPLCKRTGVKLLWAKADGDKTIKTCKMCGE